MGKFNGLNDTQEELLDMLSEEAGEIVQAVAKIKRHGYASSHPNNTGLRNGGEEYTLDPTKDNRADLEKEIGDLLGVTNALKEVGDVNPLNIHKSAATKMARSKPFLHNIKFWPSGEVLKDW